MGVQPGEVFVHRNIGNMFTNKYLSIMSVINYAITQLKYNTLWYADIMFAEALNWPCNRKTSAF